MDFDLAKQCILLELKNKGLLTNDEMLAKLNADQELLKKIRVYLVANKYAKDCNDSDLVYIEAENRLIAEHPECRPASQLNQEVQIEISHGELAPVEKDHLEPPHMVFISYGRKEDELALVKRLHDDLLEQKKVIIDAYLDLKNIGNDVWDKNIEEGIEKSSVFLAVISPHAIRKESICRDETAYAYNHHKPIIPVMFRFEQDSKLPLLLCRRNWIDFSGDYDEAFKCLCKYLEGDINAAHSPLHPIISGIEPLDFGPEIARYTLNYVDRPWINERINDWIRFSSTQGFIIVGNPGSGKSAVAAWLSTYLEERVIGIHFCSSSNPRSLEQMEFVANLVAQLYTQIPEYAKIIKEFNYAREFKDATSALRELVIQPLNSIKKPDLSQRNPYIIIIDSLDEAMQKGNESIFTLLLKQIHYFPPWLRIIATTRPESGILDRLGTNFTTLMLSDFNEENNEDINRFLDRIIGTDFFSKIFKEKNVNIDEFKDLMIARSGGIFLYIIYVMNAIEQGDIDPRVPEMFPKDFNEFYSSIFNEKFPDELDYDPVREILGVVVAAKESLTSTEIGKFVKKDKSQVETILKPLSALFIRDSRFQFRLFHNSLKEWLKGEAGGNSYKVNLTQANSLIIDACWKEYQNGVGFMSPYAINHLGSHLLEANQYQDLVTLYTNPKFFVKSWEQNEFAAKIVWAEIEKKSDFRIIHSYKSVLEHPSEYPDDFVTSFSEFLTDIGYHTESIVLLEHVLKIYLQELDDDKIQHSLAQLAWALYLEGEKDKSEKSGKFYQRSKELLKIQEFICKNRGDTFNLQIGLGYQAGLEKDVFRVIDLEIQREHLCLEVGEKGKYWEQISVGNRGTTLNRYKLSDLAFQLYQKKEHISTEIGNYQGLQWALGYQGAYYLAKKDYSKALQCFTKQFEIANSISYYRGMESSLGDQLVVYEIIGDKANATRVEEDLTKLKKTHAHQNLELNLSNDEIFRLLQEVCAAKEKEYTLSADDRGLVKVIGLKAILEELKENYDAAILLYNQQEKIGKTIENSIIINNAIRNVWGVYQKKGDIKKAIEISEEHPEVFKELWAKYDLINFQDILIKAFSNSGNLEVLEFFLIKQILFADENALFIPCNSFIKQIEMVGKSKDVHRIAWLIKHKTEFDIIMQILAVNNISPDTVEFITKMSGDIANVFYQTGRFNDSFLIYDSLKGIYSIKNDTINVENSIGHMGLNKEALGEFHQALEYYRDQASICRELSQLHDLTWAIANQGDIHKKLGNLEDALRLYEEQEKLSETNNYTYWLRRSKQNIGEIYKDCGEYSNALKKYQEMESKCSEDSIIGLLGQSLENQADIYYRIGKIDKAIELYEKSADLYKRTEELFDQWRVLTKSAVLCHTSGKFEHLNKNLKRKEEIIRSIDDEKIFTFLLGNQDHIHTIRFDIDQIFEWYIKKIILAREAKAFYSSISREIPDYFINCECKLIEKDEYAMIEKLGDLCKTHKFEMGLQYFYGFRGLYQMIITDYSGALESFTNQRDECRKIGYLEGLQVSTGRLADLFFTQGDLTHAKNFTDEQIIIAEDVGSIESLLKCKQRLADILIIKNDFAQARKIFEFIAESSEKIGSNYQTALSYYKIGLTYKANNCSQDAISWFKKLEDIGQESNDQIMMLIGIMKQAELYRQMDNSPELVSSLSKLKDLTR